MIRLLRRLWWRLRWAINDNSGTVMRRPDAPGWWWADETWDLNGPCRSREEAVAAQNLYVRDYLGV